MTLKISLSRCMEPDELFEIIDADGVKASVDVDVDMRLGGDK